MRRILLVSPVMFGSSIAVLVMKPDKSEHNIAEKNEQLEPGLPAAPGVGITTTGQDEIESSNLLPATNDINIHVNATMDTNFFERPGLGSVSERAASRRPIPGKFNAVDLIISKFSDGSEHYRSRHPVRIFFALGMNC